MTVLNFLALVAGALGWLMVIITARYPRGLFDFMVGVGRYATRVQAYTTILVTDRYPPFRLAPKPPRVASQVWGMSLVAR